MTFDQVAATLPDFNPTQLRDISLLANHLRPPTPPDCSYHNILCRELESYLGTTHPRRTIRLGVARRLYERMRELGLLQNYHDIARYVQRVTLAIINAMKRDDVPLTWGAISRYVIDLDVVLEREFPHYRVTSVLARR